MSLLFFRFKTKVSVCVAFACPLPSFAVTTILKLVALPAGGFPLIRPELLMLSHAGKAEPSNSFAVYVKVSFPGSESAKVSVGIWYVKLPCDSHVVSFISFTTIGLSLSFVKVNLKSL